MSQIVAGPQTIGTLSNPVRVDPTGTTPQPVTESGNWSVSVKPSGNASGWTPFSFLAMNNTVTLIKTGPGQVGGYDFLNPNANNTYIQVFDVAAANNVTLGNTTPTYVIARGANMAWNHELVNGIQHNNGIVVAATTQPSGNLSPANNLTGFFLYK